MSTSERPAVVRPELLRLIFEYQRKVSEACRLLRGRLQVDDLLNSWTQRKVPQIGWLDDAHSARFFFHGIGCRVSFGPVEVDFDFGPNERHDGFDASRLAIFAATVGGHTQFKDQKMLAAELESLQQARLLVRLDPGLFDGLYYFADEVSNDALEK